MITTLEFAVQGSLRRQPLRYELSAEEEAEVHLLHCLQ